VPWIRAGGEVQRDVTANPKRCCVQNSVLLSGPVLPGLERPVCDRSHGPGTGLAQRDRLQACPRVRRRRRAQPARPQHEGCTKSAQDGGTPHCKAHGEGKRCHQVGCAKSALRRHEACIAHGGGRRCHHEGCCKAAATGGTQNKAHGGGRRCQHEGCCKSAVTGGTPH
jgi:hypothetical protein